MALTLDAFSSGARRGPTCSFGRLLGLLTPQDAEVVRAALADDTITASTIAAVLRSNGHDIGDHTVARHRAGKCKC